MLFACKHAKHAEDPSYAKQSVSMMSATAFCIRNLGHHSQYRLAVTRTFTQQDEFQMFAVAQRVLFNKQGEIPTLLNLNNEKESRYTWPSNTRQRLLQWTLLFMNISNRLELNHKQKTKKRSCPQSLRVQSIRTSSSCSRRHEKAKQETAQDIQRVYDIK